MKMKKIKLKDSAHILYWIGPFGYYKGKIVEHIIDPSGPTKTDFRSIKGKKGIYCIVGDHLIYGPRSLLYIGRTEKTFRERLADHGEWLNDEWRVELYLAEIEPGDLQKSIEKLLIYAHSPAYNSQHIESFDLKEPFKTLTIWNEGRFWGLLPEISSKHPWYEQAKERVKATKEEDG